MSGTLSKADLVADLKASLHDAANVFTADADADFGRLLDVAALDFNRVRPRIMQGTLTLTADGASYAAPAGITGYKSDTWSNGKQPQPWAANATGRLPLVHLARSGADLHLVFMPAPTAQQIAVFGSSFSYSYLAAHAVGTSAADTTILAGDRGLLLLRAQAEAMREMSMRNAGKPVNRVDSGFSGTPRNGTPSALYAMLMEEFERGAA